MVLELSEMVIANVLAILDDTCHFLWGDSSEDAHLHVSDCRGAFELQMRHGPQILAMFHLDKVPMIVHDYVLHHELLFVS